MADDELREELLKLGFKPGPITDSTRNIYKKKLKILKANPPQKKSTRRSEGGTRNRRTEPQEDNEGDWDDDEERSSVSYRPSRTLQRNSYGGGGRSDTADDSISDSCAHVGDSGLWRNDRSSLPGGLLSRSIPGSGYYSEYEQRSFLGGDRIPRTSNDYSENLGQGSRSSLGSERYTRNTSDYGSYLGQESKSTLGSDRFPKTSPDYVYLGQTNRASLGGDLFTKHTSDYGGYLGREIRSSLGSERFPKTTSDYGTLEQEVRSPLGGERFTRNTSDYGGYLGQELRPRAAGERSSWSSLPANRDEGRQWSRYSDWDAKDQLSYTHSADLSRGKSGQSKQNWSKTLEYYLSKLVRALSVGLFIVFLCILIMKSGIFYSTQQDDIKLIPPDCEGKDDKYCQVMQKQIILEILSELHNFLSIEAGSFECGNPSGLSSKCIPIKRAKEHVLNVFNHAPEKFDSALDWLLHRDEHLGIWVKGEDGEIVTTGSHASCVESSRPLLGITCRLINALYTTISNLFLALFGVFVLWLFLIYLRYHWRKLEEEEKQMFSMVEKIIDVVKHHYKDYQQRIEQHPYIGVLHVRDTLIMPQDRKRMKKIWDRAAQFVENNESRLRTESQRVAGADLLVWRWTQTRHEIPSERSLFFTYK